MPKLSAPLLTTRDLNRATLARQLLLARADLDVAAAVSRLAGMQAQVPKPPYVGLWTRLAGFERQHLSKALHDRTVVRATMMRATLHLATAGDYMAWRGAMQAMLAAPAAARFKDEALDVAGIVGHARAFFDAQPATFEALRDHLVAAYPGVNDRALGYTARMNLPLVMVPTDGPWAFPTNAAFAVAETWLGRPVPTATDPTALVRAYLGAFGPASVADAQKWSALGGLKPVFAALRDQLVVFTDARGRELFDLPDAPRPDGDTPAPVRFLPDFDNLVLAHDDRSRIVDDEHRPKLVSKNLLVAATYMVDGRVAGTWKIARQKASATLTLSPFYAVPKADMAALEAEGLALLAFAEPDAKKREIAIGE